MVKQINEPVKTIKIGYNEWKVYEKPDGSCEYWHCPFSIAATLFQKITIRYNEFKKMYDFTAEDYCSEVVGDSWNRWMDYTNEIKDTFVADAMQRIGK